MLKHNTWCNYACMYDWIHERIDQSSSIASRGRIQDYIHKFTTSHYCFTVPCVSHLYPTTFQFSKNNFFTHPTSIQRPTTGLFVNVWLHIHPTAGMEKGGMSASLCNRSLWPHFCSSKIYMRPPWTLSNCIWRFSTLQRRYLTFGHVSVLWRWNMWFSQNSFWGSKTSR